MCVCAFVRVCVWLSPSFSFCVSFCLYRLAFSLCALMVLVRHSGLTRLVRLGWAACRTFGLEVMEQGVCACGATSEPLTFHAYLEYIAVALLRDRGWRPPSAAATTAAHRTVRPPRLHRAIVALRAAAMCVFLCVCMYPCVCVCKCMYACVCVLSLCASPPPPLFLLQEPLGRLLHDVTTQRSWTCEECHAPNEVVQRWLFGPPHVLAFALVWDRYVPVPTRVHTHTHTDTQTPTIPSCILQGRTPRHCVQVRVTVALCPSAPISACMCAGLSHALPPSLSLSVCLSVRLSVCLSVCLSV
jgi:hypothetical protein